MPELDYLGVQLPSNVQTVVANARSAMRKHPAHELSPIHRRAIYEAVAALGALVKNRTCRYLALLAARRVLPVWIANRPDDSMPQDVVDIAEAIWQGIAHLDTAQSKLAAGWQHFEQLAETPFGETQAFFAGFATVIALAEQLGREPLIDIAINFDTTDMDLDPWSSDTALYAAAAYGGPVWDPRSNPAKRREFWEWWLDAAIPEAWRTGTSALP